MRIIEPSAQILWPAPAPEILRAIEAIGRTAYKSEALITDESAPKFVASIVQRGHLSVIEHVAVSARVVCDRGVSHEIVRHRIASYTQESTRYCNYSKDAFGGELTFILPRFLWDRPVDETRPARVIWVEQMELAERAYMRLLALGSTPQEARSVLPNSLKTELVMTMNLREWLHFFELRTAKAAHPDMRWLALGMQLEFRKWLPCIFGQVDDP